MKEYIKDPMGIEIRSFEIIGEEMGPHNFDEKQLQIVKRVIHTTADFDYQNIIHFSEDAIEKAKDILSKGVTIYTDTNMALSGMSKPALKKLNCNVECYVAREDVRAIAKEKKITRSMAGVEKAVEEGVEFFVFGNAPTAIFKLLELVEEGKAKPKFVIGAPVGFVGAKESKELLEKYNIPTITIRGRKGGSTVVAAIMNAIMYMMVER
ncbi:MULTISPECIES: precorrin-8X methylmutase [unclassified Clostridium]|uniref:precorrin-8X methylmutase n=1 Tax=unclassified Clostridium TaxID=2614128 RepID=UPI000EECF5C1|nr:MULTISPECIES: precorrin-8X methylmutase [unclassified Clostridium]HCQ89871.1 precorrin-8X methylmutase [Clostridium sp.]